MFWLLKTVRHDKNQLTQFIVLPDISQVHS